MNNNNALMHLIRKIGGGGVGLAAGERAFIPKPPRLGNLGRMANPRMPHVGMIHSVVPGRTDKLPMSVKGGSYVVPADVVSGVGQGNSSAGANSFNKLLKMGPYGAAINPIGTPKINFGHLGAMPGTRGMPMPRADTGMAAGGTEGGPQDHIPIIAAGGEFVIPEDKVREIGGGDIKRGHETLDKLVLMLRKKTVNEMRKLKPPKKN